MVIKNILYWFFIPVIYIVISSMIMKKQYYWIFVLFWEKGILYTLAELISVPYFMLSNDRMHAEGADWVRRYCTGISICIPVQRYIHGHAYIHVPPFTWRTLHTPDWNQFQENCYAFQNFLYLQRLIYIYISFRHIKLV